MGCKDLGRCTDPEANFRERFGRPMTAAHPPSLNSLMSVDGYSATYVFQLRPPIGSGATRQSIVIAQLRSDDEALNRATELHEKLSVDAITVYRVHADTQELIGAIPVPKPIAQGNK